MKIRTALAAAAAATLLLGGCASSPQAQLNEATSAVVERANQGDAEGLRRAADDLADLVRRLAGGELDPAEVRRRAAAGAAALVGESV